MYEKKFNKNARLTTHIGHHKLFLFFIIFFMNYCKINIYLFQSLVVNVIGQNKCLMLNTLQNK